LTVRRPLAACRYCRLACLFPRTRAKALNLTAQGVPHFSSSGKIDDFVFGVECVDDGAQARLTLLNMTLTCEN
jgi:hypothetical protein